jgi:diacylglycerol kinase (ATP)
VEGAEIVEAVRELGWSVTVLDGGEVEKACDRPADVIIVAGGDGTIGRVAKRLAGTRLPIAVVPTGTANNVARTLGIALQPRSAIGALAQAVVRDVDLGVVATRDGSDERFIEGFGIGVFAHVMAERATEEQKTLDRASTMLAKELENYEPLHVRIDVDGRNMSGDFLLVSVLNVRSLGPALQLAPHASFDDGKLDLVLVRPEDRGAFVAKLHGAARTPSNEDIALPPLERHRTKHVHVRSYRTWAHIDDRSRELEGDVDVRIVPRAVRFLLPATRA